jgi:FAD/FMN-containing dehydrogenase
VRALHARGGARPGQRRARDRERRRNADLYWAIRGGGGNFDVVTSFVFRLHPVAGIVGGVTLWPIESTPEIMRWYREFIAGAPRELYGWLGLHTVPPAPIFPEELHLRKVAFAAWCWSGLPEQADEVFAPVREIGPPILDGIQEMPYPALQSAFDDFYCPGLQCYWRHDFVRELPDEAIARHVEFGKRLPTVHSTMHLYPVDGAVHDVASGDTAFNFRDAQWSQVMVGVDPDPARADELHSFAVDYWEALHPYSARGAYVNMVMDESPQRVRASYGDNYERLARVKEAYDPDNVFRLSQNIPPAG